MPGKVNPVICESMVQVACQVVGCDAAITLGGFGGVGSILDLNVAMPMIADNLLYAIRLLTGACGMFRARLLDGLAPDEERCASLIEGSLAMCTSLAPVIGYDKAAQIAKAAYEQGRTVREVAREISGLSEEELDRLLDPVAMTRPSP